MDTVNKLLDAPINVDIVDRVLSVVIWVASATFLGILVYLIVKAGGL